jgi:formylglycine-generating enzyme required for sulfatase activity
LSNHPVIGVSWYEALAFTRWFSERSGLSVRLPTEAEWEYAVRYPDGRRFPWGDDYLSGCANINECDSVQSIGHYHLKRTTAVGLYPQGVNAVGIHDLCGNSAEWCLSPWTIPYRHHTAHEVSTEGNIGRAWRGGSWYYGVTNARAASRGWDYPHACDTMLGFRLLLETNSSANLPTDFNDGDNYKE